MNKAQQQHILEAQLQECMSDLQSLGAKVDGYSGGSPEGDLWRYSFNFESPIPPDRAAAAIRICWKYGWGKSPEDNLTVHRSASIFREGAISSFENQSEIVMKINEQFKLLDCVVLAVNRCKSDLEKASNKSINFASSAPDALTRAGY